MQERIDFDLDSAAWIIFLVLGLFVFIIYVAQKDSSSGSEPTPTPPPVPTPKPPEPAPPKKEEQKYVSIYEYTSVQSVKKCAYCDGENTYGTKVCCICGNDIDS